MTEEMRCARHPQETTSLSCSRCGKPVCVRCMVYTPVGIRCRECATERRSGIFAPSGRDLIRAAGAAVVAAAAAGVVWGLFPAYGFWIALILGFGGGEAVSLAANRKRGVELQAVAGLMAVSAFVIALLVSRALGAGLESAVIFQTLMATLALVLAVIRQG